MAMVDPAHIAAAVDSPGHHALRSQLCFDYDTTRYPFRELVAAMMGLEAHASASATTLPTAVVTPSNDGSSADDIDVGPPRQLPLHRLHLTGVLGSLPFDPAASCKKEKKALDQRYHAASAARERFFVVYRRFLTEIVGPAIRSQLAGTTALFVQHFPVLRVSPPSTTHIGKRHKDSDYHHQPGQLNLWLQVALGRCGRPKFIVVRVQSGTGRLHPV